MTTDAAEVVLGLLPPDGSPLPYEELAALAPLDRVTLARTLANLFSRGLVRHEHNHGWRRI